MWVCSVKDCRTGFGDLVDAFIQVGSPTGYTDIKVDSSVDPRSTPSRGTASEPGGSSPTWPLLAFGAVIALGLVAVGVSRLRAVS